METNVSPMSAVTQEIPSIVVHNGSSSSPDSPQMPPGESQPDPSGFRAPNEIANVAEEGPLCFIDSKEEGVLVSATLLSSTSPLPAPELVNSPLCCKSPSSSRTVSPSHDPLAENPSEIDMAIGQRDPSLTSSVDDGRSRSLDFHQLSTESEDLSHGSSTRNRNNAKKMLQRSNAMRDDCSPPPNMLEPCPQYVSHMGSNNSLTVDAQSGGYRRPGMHSFSRQGSSENSPIQSRCSPESGYTDGSGINMAEFLAMTFNKSRKDRSMLLDIELELIKLLEDKSKGYHRFQPISSYHRMLVHRCAAYFGMGHSSEHTGSGIVVSKEQRTRIPPFKFAELASQSNEKKSILQREYGSLEDSHYKNYRCMEARRTKSLEEREEAYEKAKKRIFYPDVNRMMSGFGSIDGSRRCPDDPVWMQSENNRRFNDYHRMRNIRPMKGESFDNQDTLNVKSFRPNVFKSNSFGGYSDQGFHNLSRGNSVASNPSMRFQKQGKRYWNKYKKNQNIPPRHRLQRHTDLDSMGRYSDYSNSSGYKTQRQDTSSTNISNTLSETPSPTTGNSSMIQNGQPYVNTDGSPYRFDPYNPPPMGKPPLNTSKYQSKDIKSKSYDMKQELPENVEADVHRVCKKHDSVDTTDEKSVKSEEETIHSQSSVSRRCLDSAQSVSELRGQLTALRVADNSSECSVDVQSCGMGQHGRHMYSQPMCYGPQPVKHYYPQHGAVDTTGQSVPMPPVGIGMTLAHPTPAHVPSTDGSSYIPGGNFAFVSIMGAPNAPGPGQEAAASPMYCAMPPAQMPLHGAVASPSSLPLQYSVASSNASSCNIVPYWHGVSNPQVYQPAAGLQTYPGQIFGSPAAAQPIPTPPPIHSSQGAVIPAGYATLPGSATSQYVMVPQPNAQNFVRPPMQVQSPPPFPLFHCGGMQGPLPPCPNTQYKPFMSASSHEPFVAVKDGHEVKPYTAPGLPLYPPNHAHFGGQNYATSITRPRYMQS